MFTRRHVLTLGTACALTPVFGAADALAQAPAPVWPTRPIQLVVPSAPGGGIGVISRILAPKLAERLGQPVTIDNRPGAAGNVAAEFVARANPDGYTLYITAAGLVINQFMMTETAYNPATDFAPVTLIGLFPNLMVVPAASRFRSIAELIAYAKANPGKLKFGSPGYGSSPHISGELFKYLADIDLTHVPYPDAAASLDDLVAGRTDVSFAVIATGLPLVKAGKLRALGVTSATRAPMAPEVPTIAEAGLRGYDTSSWFAFVVPARTPPDIIRKIHDDTVASLADAAVQRRFAELGILPIGSSPAALAALLKSETARWGPVIRRAGIRINE